MDKAKQAISGFLHRDGKHDTTIHETIDPAVTNEHITRTQHENVTKAVDREVHQDHYHTSVQPIKDKEILLEQHTHNLAGVEQRNFKHGDDSHIRDCLSSDRAQFKNTLEVGDVHHSVSAGKDIVGEHIHHHVHENIQPVIQKETIQPSVVHTIIPVHEVHQNEAKHHAASALPAMTMDEFKRQGGSLNGRDERRDEFQGVPRSVGGTWGGSGARGTTSLTESEGSHTSRTQHSTNTRRDSSTSSSSSNNSHKSKDTQGKPSLLDKVNPMKDSNRDGKAGFMK